MKKILLFLIVTLAFNILLNSQPTVLGTQLVNGSYTTYDLTVRGAVRYIRLLATSGASSGLRNWEFATGTAASTNYSTNWRPYTSGQTLSGFNTLIDPASATSSARYNTGSGGQSGLLPAITNTNYYTVVVGTNSASNNFMSILQSSYNPVSLTSSRNITTPNNNQTVTVTVTLSGTKNASEKVFLRWSTDAFASNNTFTEITNFSGNVGTATIPPQTNGTTVSYYILSTEQSSPSSSNIDYFTLNVDNNSNSNYSYIVDQNSWESAISGNWSSAATWATASSVPNSSSHNVFIKSGQTLTLDQTATLATLTINSSATFNSSDATARTLTISKSTSGSSTTLSNSGTWQNGAGTSTVVFTGSPSSGDAGHTITGTINFQNITVEKSGGTSNVGVSFSGAGPTVLGTFKVGVGGYVSSAPPSSFYGTNAILKFDQGSGATYDVNASDNSWSTSQIPNNITISSGTVNLNSSRTAPGNLLIDGGTLVLNLNTPTLTIGGNWTRTSGTFTSGTGTVALTGTTNATITTATPASLYNLTINKTGGASVTLASNMTVSNILTLTAGNLSIGANTLTLNGTTTRTSGNLTGSSSSNLSVTGTGALGTLYFDQTTDGTTNILNNITVNRTSTGTLSLGNKLVLLDTYTPTAGTLTTNGFLHLRSDATKTARIATIISGGITGDVTIERYIPAARKWRAVCVPLTGSSNNSIYYNWQNNGSTIANTGVELWKPSGSNGLTNAGASANILSYAGGNTGTGSGGYTQLSATNTTGSLFTSSGPVPYLVFATGPYGSANVISGSAPTTLKATGTLNTGAVSFTGLAVGYHFIPNPYPSAINFATLGKTSVNNTIYMWDPQLTGTGNYQTTAAGTTVPGGGSYSGNSTIIPNGASFFIYSNGGGSISFAETDKATGDFNIFGRGDANGNEILRANILKPSAGNILTDGVATVYNATGNAAINGDDAVKFNNPTEGIAVRRANQNFAIEVRPLVTANDTMFVRLLNMNQLTYTLELKAEYFSNIAGLEATLKDAYTNTSTIVNLAGTTNYSFTVDANATSSGDRFMIVFRTVNPLPVNITSIKATQKAATVVVDWTVENEVNIANYQVQKSTDGRNFEVLNTVKANNGKAYSSTDFSPVQGANYYRVMSIGDDGSKKYSNIVLVKIGVKNSAVSVYPNPIKGNTINLQLQNTDKGDYELQVMSTLGQVLFTKKIQHNGGSASQSVLLPNNFASGNYVLKLASKEAIIYSEKIIVQ